MSRDSVVGVSIRLQTGIPENCRSIFGRTVPKNVSFIPRAHTGYGAQSAFRSMSTGGYFPQSIKRSEVSSPFAVEIKNEWSSTSTPTYAFLEYTSTTLSLPRYLNKLTDAMSSDRPSKTVRSISRLAWLP